MKLKLFNNPGPAEQLILSTARDQWRLVAVNLGSSLLEAFSEGAALAVVFMAVQVLSSDHQYNWATNPVVSRLPALVLFMNGLPRIPLFLGLLALSVVMQLLQSSSRYVNALSVGYLAARCRALITARVHRQILSFSYPCASSYRVGDLADLIALAPEAVRISIEQRSKLLVNSLLAGIYLLILYTLSPWLLLLAIVLALLISLIQKRLLPRIRKLAKNVSSEQLQISATLTEQIQGLRLLHSLGSIDDSLKAIDLQTARLENSLRSQLRLANIIDPVSQLLPVLASSVLGASSLLVFGDKSSGILPSLITFVLALQRLNVRVGGIASIRTILSENAGRMTRLDSILLNQDKQFRRIGGIPFLSLARRIELRDVCLSYAGSDKPSLQNIYLEIPKGKTIALVGPSGSGKSSIIDLIVGLYAPSHGSILVDNEDIFNFDLASWQKHIGVVSQDTFLFNASIAENIGYGIDSVSRRQVQEAAAAAGASRFIADLPMGYDTPIGERGFRLSGGQRQRLSLARAICRQPDLLILDEATSALDSQSERIVQDAIAALPGFITKIVVAHRLSTIADADMIVVLEKGRIIQKGTHDQLLTDTTGLYRALWLYQSGMNFVSTWDSKTP